MSIIIRRILWMPEEKKLVFRWEKQTSSTTHGREKKTIFIETDEGRRRDKEE